MMLAGVLLKLGSYGLMIFLPYVKMNGLISTYFVLSLLGCIVGSLTCLRQRDIKLLVAYSSVVHMGVVNLGLIRGREFGYSCALMIVLGHGLRSPFLFAFSF